MALETKLSNSNNRNHTLNMNALKRRIKRSANSGAAEVLSLQADMDSYIKMLKSKTPAADTHATTPNKEVVAPRGRRTSKLAATSIISTIKPILTSFLNIGKARLGTMAAARFISAALPLSSLLVLGINILALVISLVTELHDPTSTTTYTTIKPINDQNLGSWELQDSPPLHTLINTNPACNDIGILITLSVPATLRSLAEALNDLARPLHRVAHDPQPISSTLRSELTGAQGYGFWSSFDPNKKQMSRFFVVRMEGPPSTATRQLAALSGNAESPLREGTLLAGSKNIVRPSAPQWSCLEFALEMAENSKRLPKTCYGPPTLNHKFYTKVPFLPDAEILKVTGRHIIQSICQDSGTQTQASRGLLVSLIPNTCDLLIDGTLIRSADAAAQPAWTRAMTLLDRAQQLKPLDHTSLPKAFQTAIRKISNKTTQPHLLNLANIINQEGHERHLADIITATTISSLAILLLALYIIKLWTQRRASGENPGNTDPPPATPSQHCRTINNYATVYRKPKTQALPTLPK
jgi:hypothetical protein